MPLQTVAQETSKEVLLIATNFLVARSYEGELSGFNVKFTVFLKEKC